MKSAHSEAFGSAKVGVGFSDAILLVVSICGFIFLILTVYSIIVVRLKTREELEDDEREEMDFDQRLLHSDVSKLTRAERRARARILAKQALRGQPQEGEVEQNHHPNLVSRKERIKAAKAMEMQERHAMEQERKKQQQALIEKAQKEKKQREIIRAQEREQEKDRIRKEKELAHRIFLSTTTVEEWKQSIEKETLVDIDIMARDYATTFEVVRERIRQLIDENRIQGILWDEFFLQLDDNQLKGISEQLKRRTTSINELPERLQTVLQRQ